jgi:putative heme-binding domain-containing protein
LQRLGALDDQTWLACARETAPREVRVHLLKILAERPVLSEPLRKAAFEAVADPDPHVRRAAAEALAAHPNLANLPVLLNARQNAAENDSHLIHVLRMALRDQLKSTDVWSGLDTLRLSDRDRRDLADVAAGVASPLAAAFLLGHIRAHQEPHDNLVRYLHHVARRGPKGPPEALVTIVQAQGRGPAERLALYRAIQQGCEERGDSLDPRVRGPAGELCRQLLASHSADQVGKGIEAARDFQFAELLPDLQALSRRVDLPEARRAEALSACVALDPAKGMVLLRGLLVDSQAPLGLRETAAIALANLEGPEPQAAVLEALPVAPERLQSTIAAALARHRGGAEALLKAIEAGKGSARLLQERPIVIGLESAEIAHLSERIAALLKGLPPADEKLKQMLADRKSAYFKGIADASQGARVFEKNCANCHQLEGKGARVGPQLDGIGTRGLERLLEDVLDPNRNVDQSFRVTNLALRNGQLVSGLLLREEGEVLIIADSQGKELRVPKASVEERSTAQLSPMPANLATQIADPEFNDLMSYLLKHREEKPMK